MLLDGTALQWTRGEWPGRVTAPDEAPPLDGEVDCMIGVETAEGIVVLPGRSDRDLCAATVPAVGVQLAGVATGTDVAGCLVVDDYNAPGPAAKRGALLRGAARIEIDGAVARVRLDADRETTWDGADTHTATAS
jgi:hypothetical protein